jgi:hypothetical protein
VTGGESLQRPGADLIATIAQRLGAVESCVIPGSQSRLPQRFGFIPGAHARNRRRRRPNGSDFVRHDAADIADRFPKQAGILGADRRRFLAFHDLRLMA